LIDRLEALVNGGTRVPLTSKALVDEQEFLELVDQLRVAVPDEVRQAKRLSQERERMISHAQSEAERLVLQAQERADQLVDQSDIVLRAQERAKEVLADAHEEARRMRADAYAYATDVLEGLEKELNRLLATIKKGKAALEKMSEENEMAGGELPLATSAYSSSVDGRDGSGA
jgi:cell division septum initiation protein DivIVA